MRDFIIHFKRNEIRKIFISFLLLGSSLMLQGLFAQNSSKRWKLVWEDDFNGTSFDTEVWSKIPRGTSDWNNTMADSDELFEVRDGKLILKGIATGDSQDPYHTGGLWTSGKQGFMGGKLEIRAKLNSGQGAWPAIWLMPFKQQESWPLEGEIDIMEHLNYDNIVYQTVHSNYTWNLGHKEGSHKTTNIDPNGFNTYGVEIQEDKVRFYVNGVKTFDYKKDPNIEESKGQFPFYREMHLILSMQLGGGWVGQVNASNLPLEMEIDWVRHYQKETIETNGDYPIWNEVDYPREGKDRVVQSLSVEGAKVNGNPINFKTIVAGENADAQTKIVFDNTTDVLEATIGNELTLSPKVKNLTWMHYYLYVDYNQNKQFDEDELVSYSARQIDGKWFNSKGTEVRIDNIPQQMPSFIIPKTAKLGKTRARFKVDWDNLSPIGNMSENNLLSKNQGTVCDFTIDIKANTSGLTSLNNHKSVILYPNPTQTSFKIEGINNITSLSIYDMKGTLVKTFSSEQELYPVAGLAEGTYILSIKTPQGHYSRQLLIK